MTEAAESQPRNARRKQRNRARLLEAARRVMARKGVDAATVAEITAEADLALGTFYNYFDSKEAVLEGVVAELLTMHGDDIDAFTATIPDPAVVMATALRHSLRRATADPIWAGFLVRNPRAGDMLSEHLGHRARRDIARGVTEGRFEVPDIDAALTALGGLLLAGIKESLSSQTLDDLDALVVCALQMLGVSTREASELARQPLPDLPSDPSPSRLTA